MAVNQVKSGGNEKGGGGEAGGEMVGRKGAGAEKGSLSGGVRSVCEGTEAC